MAKKLIKVMDTSFRDGFQSVYGARVFVEIYDGAQLHASADEQSKVFVYDHGGNIETHGNVTIRDKRKAGE